MYFKSAKNPRLIVLRLVAITLVAALAVLTLIYLQSFIKYLLAAFELFVIVLLTSALVSTGYELADVALIFKNGFMRSELPYAEIKTAARTRGTNFITALAINRLELNAGLDPTRGKIVLAPEREDEFLAELSKRCPELEITQ